MILLRENFLAMASKQKALFLDRDGVINVEKNYLHKIEDVEFIDGIFELCRHFEALGHLIIIVTNQSGIARGMYSEADFLKLSEWMIKKFKNKGVAITQIYHCPHHPEFSGECECRKPKPKMLLDAQVAYNIDMQHSILVGDSERDIEAAVAANVGEQVLLSSDKTIKSRASQIVKELRCLF